MAALLITHSEPVKPSGMAACCRQIWHVAVLCGLSSTLTCRAGSQRVDEVLGSHLSLSQNPPQCADSQFMVQWHHAPDGSFGCLLPKNDMTAALTHLFKP